MHEITSRPAPPADFAKVRKVEGFAEIKSSFPTYMSDESNLTLDPFDFLFFPKNEAELAAVLQEMGRRGVKVTIAGARTGLVGGCVPPEGALISLEHFDRVLSIYYVPQAEEWRLRVQCAVTLRDLNAMAVHKRFPELERCGDEQVLNQLKRFEQERASYFYPPDPTETSASLGGTVATNASGAHTFRYGPTRAWVRGLRVMLASGEFLEIPRGKYFASPSGWFVIYDSKGKDYPLRVPDYAMPRTKNTSGFFTTPYMDLIDLFIGSEGAFGAITEVDVALLKMQDRISIVQFTSSDEQAISLVEALRADKRLKLDFLEFYAQTAIDILRQRQKEDPKAVDMPPIPEEAKAAVFFDLAFDPLAEKTELGALAEVATNCGESLANSWAGYEARERERFRVFRHVLPEWINVVVAQRKKNHPGLHKLGTDLAVPDERLKDMWEVYNKALKSAGLEWLAYGHIGNNHVHLNVLPRNMDEFKKAQEIYVEFAKKAVEFGGTVSAEHGIGKTKSKFLRAMFNEAQIAQMRAAKKALDPNEMLNPGNIFPA
jgi:D-lactate dehydrogenase (cytochrome)